MKNIQLTCAHALVKFLIAQKTLIDGKKAPLFPGVFGIFGHCNVACLGQALQETKKSSLLGGDIMNKIWLLPVLHIPERKDVNKFLLQHPL